MRMRRLGSSELQLSVIGLGTWAIGGGGWKFGWGPQEDRESIYTIGQALDLGVNWIDTAAVYGFGHSEAVLGEALSDMRGKPIVATKCGRHWDDEGNIYGNLKRDSIRREADASLQRLGIDVIDLYQIHWPIPDEDIEEAWATIGDLIREGKVRYGGVSNFSIEQIRRVQALRPVASAQLPYSMLNRGIEAELLGFCADNNIGVLCYSPMQKGLLTGAWSKERVDNLAPDDHRRNDTHFQEPEFSINLKLVDGLGEIAERNGRPLAHLPIAWVLRRPEVTAAIVGARRPSQIEETASAGDWELSDEDTAAIDRLLEEREQALKEAQ